MIYLVLATVLLATYADWRLRTMVVWKYPSPFKRFVITYTYQLERVAAEITRQALPAFRALAKVLER